MNDRWNSVIQVFLDPSTSWSMEWECCVICHVREIKTLMSSQGQVPAAGSGYRNFNENAMQFIWISSRPVDIDPYQLNDGEDTEAVLRNHSASWHKNLVICTLTLERASKHKHSETYESHSQCKTRSKLATSLAPLKTWFICDRLEGNVFKSSTIQSDNRVGNGNTASESGVVRKVSNEGNDSPGCSIS